MFKIVPKADQNKWKLSSEMADYANQMFEEHLSDNDVKEKVLVDYPVPSNLDQVKTLDDFMKALLNNSSACKKDSLLERIQQKIVDVMGPFSKLWKGLEDVLNTKGEDPVEVPVGDLVDFAEKCVLLLGEVSNGLTYLRRSNALQYLMKDTKQVKAILREKSELLQKHDDQLFGKKFLSHIIEAEKSKKKSLEVFDSKFSSQHQDTKKRPFRHGPSPQGSSGGGRYFFQNYKHGGGHQHRPNNNGRPRYGHNKAASSSFTAPGNNTSSTENCTSKGSISSRDTRAHIGTRTPVNKKFIYW